MNKQKWISLLLVLSVFSSGYLGKVINDKNEKIATLNNDINKVKEDAEKETTLANEKILKLEKEKNILLKKFDTANKKINTLERLIKVERIKAEEKKQSSLKEKREMLLYKDLASIERKSKDLKKLECLSPNAITDDMEIIVAGGYSGKKLPESIDLSGHTAHLMDVHIDNEEKEVVLLLSSYEPTIWNIQKTKETKINQVVLTGYYGQKIKGLDSDIPVLYRDRNSVKGSSCSYLSSIDDAVNGLSNELFDRKVDKKIKEQENGVIFIGDKNSHKKDFIQDTSMQIEDFYLKDRLLSGPDGLAQLVKQNKMKEIDYMEAEKLIGFRKNVLSLLYFRSFDDLFKGLKNNSVKAYLVVDDMRFPSGLSAMHVFKNNKHRHYLFIIDKGVSFPAGSKGHSTVIRLDM